MGLLDSFKKRQQEKQGDGGMGGTAPRPTEESDTPVSADIQRLQQLMNLPLREWIKESESEWEKCNANAPAQSETSAETVRDVLQTYLPLDETVSVQRMQLLIFNWTTLVKQAPMTFSVCQSCGHQLHLLGEFQGVALPSSCSECQGPVKNIRIVYSREVGRAIREFLLGHVRCIEAIKSLHDAVSQDLLSDTKGLERKLNEALAIAKQERHRTAEAAVTRVTLVIKLALSTAVASATVGAALAATTPAAASNNEPAKTDLALGNVLQLIRVVTFIGHACSDAKDPKLASQAYQQAIDLRFKLLTKFPKDVTLRKDQAYDLDELGMTLRNHEPHRRPEALALVRQAMQMMDSLDHDDPSGRAERQKDSQAIRAHLNLGW